MNHILRIVVLAAVVAGTTFTACKKDDGKAPPTADTGKVYLEFFNVVGGSNLNLNNQWYRNTNGDSFRVSKFNYYISNIRLNDVRGTAFTEPESYHLIEQPAGPAQLAFDLRGGVPAGTYTSITFMIGVDSARNVSGAQDGDLDPVLGNFWSWNTGYIMLKFEGESPQSPVAGGRLVLHSGGFSGANNVLKTVTLQFPQPIDVTKRMTPHIHLQADVQELFRAPNRIDFRTVNTIHMPGANAARLAENYAGMFRITYAGY